MATIASLAVLLTASAGGLIKGFKDGERATDGFEHKIEGLKHVLEGALAGVGVGLSLAGVTELVHHSMEAIETTTHLAQRLGDTTEAISGLNHAAAMGGVSAETFGGMLQKLQKNLGAAASAAAGGLKLQQVGDAALDGADALDELGASGGKVGATLRGMGLDVRKLASEAPSEAFKDIADKIAGIENPAERARQAFVIFGRSGQQLITVLSQGRAGIEAYEREAKTLGIVFSEIDGEKVIEANRALIRTKEAVQGIGNRLAIAFAPVIEDLANRAAFAIAALGPKIDAAAISAGRMIHTAIEWVDANRQMLLSLGKAAAEIIAVAVVLPRLASGLGAIPSLARLAGLSLAGGFNPLVLAGTLAVGAFTAVLIRNVATQESWTESCYQSARAAGFLRDVAQDMGAGLERLGQVRQKLRELQSQLEAAKDDRARLDIVNEQIAAQQELLETLKKTKELQGATGGDSAKDTLKGALLGGLLPTDLVPKLDAGALAGGVLPFLGADDRVTAPDVGIDDKQVQDAREKLHALQDIQEQLAKAVHVNPGAENKAAVEGLLSGLREQAAVAGHSAQELQLYKLALAGATEEQMRLARALVGAKAIGDLQLKISTFGFDETEARLRELQKLGAPIELQVKARELSDFVGTLERLGNLKTPGAALALYNSELADLTQQLAEGKLSADEFRDHFEGLQGAIAKSSEALTQIDAGNAMEALQQYAKQLEALKEELAAGALDLEAYKHRVDELNDSLNARLEDRAKQIKESLKTPAQELREQIQELNELYQRGLLSADELRGATAKLAQERERAISDLIRNQLSGAAPAGGLGFDTNAHLLAANEHSKLQLFDSLSSSLHEGVDGALAAAGAGVGANLNDTVQDKQYAEQAKATKLLDDILRALKNAPPVRVSAGTT